MQAVLGRPTLVHANANHIRAAPLGAVRPASTPRGLIKARASAVSEDLHALLLEKEKQLASMFEPQPGKRMPKASQIAQLRREVARLRDRVHGGDGNASYSAAEAEPPYTVNRGMSDWLPASKAEEQLKANSGLGAYDDVEIARLEAENTVLRAEAHQLLVYQQQLEELWQQQVAR